MREWRDAERRKAAERHAKVAEAQSTVGIFKRPGGGERGGGGRDAGRPAKRLKSGSGHNRLEVCGPSNGRHKLAQGRHDFIALLRSSPSAIDALDTFYEPNSVFGQFLGSCSGGFVFPFLSLLPLLVFSFLFLFRFIFINFLFLLSVLFFYFLLFSFLFVFLLLFLFFQSTGGWRAHA